MYPDSTDSSNSIAISSQSNSSSVGVAVTDMAIVNSRSRGVIILIIS